MSAPSPLLMQLQVVLTSPTRGIAALVNDFLTVCHEQRLQLNWQAGHLHARALGGDAEDEIDVPIPKSVFRAILARVAALCDERSPGSVSPYGGAGELSIEGNPPKILRVAFTNTPGEQRVDLTPVPAKSIDNESLRQSSTDRKRHDGPTR
jgi:hypothetical protein